MSFEEDLFDDVLEDIDDWFEEDAHSHNDGDVQLGELTPGAVFCIGNEKYIALEHVGEWTRVIQQKCDTFTEEFGNSADWKESPIRERLNTTYLSEIAEVVGEHNIIPMVRDLTSLDGLDSYGSCEDRISLLTAFEYAKYHRILGFDRYSTWWWLITPFSTPEIGYSRYVCCVDSDGTLGWSGCGCSYGVRPFFTLNSSIYVSVNLEDEE